MVDAMGVGGGGGGGGLNWAVCAGGGTSSICETETC